MAALPGLGPIHWRTLAYIGMNRAPVPWVRLPWDLLGQALRVGRGVDV